MLYHPILNQPVSNEVCRVELLHNPQLLEGTVEQNPVLVSEVFVVFSTRRLNPHLTKFEEEAPEASHGPVLTLGPNFDRAGEPRTRPAEHLLCMGREGLVEPFLPVTGRGEHLEGEGEGDRVPVQYHPGVGRKENWGESPTTEKQYKVLYWHNRSVS